MRPSGDHIKQFVRLYKNGTSLTAIATQFDVSPGTVANHLRRLDVPLRRRGAVRYQKNVVKLTMRQKRSLRELVDGLLLGDGSAAPSRGLGCLRLTQNKVRVGWVQQIRARLTALGIMSRVGRTASYDARTKRTYLGVYVESLRYACIEDCTARWYSHARKRVPADVTLTPQVVADWISGDGSSAHGGLSLHTQCFNLREIRLLCVKLMAAFDVDCWPTVHSRSKSDGRAMYRIYISRGSAPKLKRACLPLMPHCTQYKFSGVGTRKTKIIISKRRGQ